MNTAIGSLPDTQAPTAPSNLTATTAGYTQINLSWTASIDNVGVTNYLVERCVTTSCTFAQIATSASTTFNNTGLTAGTGYSYRVRATDAAGNLSAYSNTAGATTTAVDTQAPTAPSNLTATTAGSTQINLSWTASIDNVGVTNYLVERCVTSSCTFAQIATTPGTTFNNTGLTASTGYSYRVRATDAAGNLSGYSNIAGATTDTAVDTQPPTAPSNLTATAAGSSQINLSWTASTDNVGLHGYSIERCLTASCTFAVIVPYITSTVYNDPGLNPSTGYNYRVQASDSAGNLSAYSNIASATTTAVDTQAPTAPSNLTATTASSTQINLSWTASTDNVGVTNYLVESCVTASCTYAQIATTVGTTLSNSGLAAGTGYSYRVRATDAAGNLGSYSNVANATTTATISGLVAAYSFNEGAGTTIADSSGTGNNGSSTNTTWTASGKYGNALIFNGSNALVTIPDSASLHLTSAMTLEVWVNPSTVNSVWRDVIYKGNDNYYLEGTSDTSSVPAVGGTFGAANANVFGTTALAANTWTHLAATYDAATLRLYVNGTQVSSSPRTGNLATSTNPLQIGGDSLYGQNFSGIIDEVRIYNVALTQAQIQSDMNAPIGTSSPSPIVSLSSNSITFGNQGTGTSSQAQPVTLTNIGSATLNITSIAVTGQNSTDFSQTNTCGASLAASANCTINVTFAPTNTGTRAASVAITDNAVLSPQTINLTGTGVGFSVSPRQTVLTYTMTQQFVVNGSGTITWSVDGVAGGSPNTGTITATGVYAPPAAVGTHTITATSSTSQSASATVYVSNYPGTFTFHNDNLRTGQNLNETVLTPANVNSLQFGLLYSYPTDGISHASPLYVANVNIPGKGFHNVVYVATEHDSVYALDADGLSTTPLWQVSFLKSGVTTVPASDTGETGDISPEIGITGTPVIDQNSGTLYVVAKTKEGSGGNASYVQRLHALDITTGAEKAGSPVVLQATVPGSGSGSSGGQLAFNSLRENQRPGLLLSNGVIYVGFASHGDILPYHGWVLGYNASTLQQVMAYCDSPNGAQGGIWQSGIGLAADATGNVYFMTGNGTFDANTGGGDYGDSFVKLSPAGTVVDYFTSHDQDIMNSNNWDLSSSGPMLLPDQPGMVPHLLVGAGKTGTVYLVNRDSMGFYNANNDNQIVQSLVNAFPNGTPEPGNYSAPVYFNGSVYFSPINDQIQAFQLSNGRLSTSPTSRSPELYPYPGGWLALSANGSSNGILWAIQRNNATTMDPGATAPGVLRAYMATNLSTELYNTSQAGSRDTLDFAAKFTVPLVANGKVFVLTNSRLMVLGLLP
jgi:chitodextrinase